MYRCCWQGQYVYVRISFPTVFVCLKAILTLFVDVVWLTAVAAAILKWCDMFHLCLFGPNCDILGMFYHPTPHLLLPTPPYPLLRKPEFGGKLRGRQQRHSDYARCESKELLRWRATWPNRRESLNLGKTWNKIWEQQRNKHCNVDELIQKKRATRENTWVDVQQIHSWTALVRWWWWQMVLDKRWIHCWLFFSI